MKLTFDGCGLNNSDHPHAPRIATLEKDLWGTSAGHEIARAATACHGLDLPADVEPGAIRDLIEKARALTENHDCPATMGLLMNALDKLQPAAPVSPSA